jgi:hypothetical protein
MMQLPTAATVRRALKLAPDVLAIIGAIIVVVAASIIKVNDDALIQTTAAILAFLATSQLIVRVTTIEKIESDIGDLKDAAGSAGVIQKRIGEVADYLHGDELDSRFITSASLANGVLVNFRRAGLSAAYNALSDVDLIKEMRLARSSIRIISTWTGCLISLGETLIEKARQGCDVRILILRHDSKYAELRGAELDPTDEMTASRQIKTEILEFNRLFRQHPELRTTLQVRAFDARPPMCMFSQDDDRLIGLIWPGLNAMDGPVVRVTAQPVAEQPSSLADIADRQFERLWLASSTKYIRVIAGEPSYTNDQDEAWSVAGETFASFIEQLGVAMVQRGAAGRKEVLDRLHYEKGFAEIALLELHEKLRNGHNADARVIIEALEETGLALRAEAVLRDAVKGGQYRFLPNLVRLLDADGRQREADEVLRRASAQGHGWATSTLASRLERGGNLGELEQILAAGAQSGNEEALTQLVSLLDSSGRSTRANILLQRLSDEGNRTARQLHAWRLWQSGDEDASLTLLREWRRSGDLAAGKLARALERSDTHRPLEPGPPDNSSSGGSNAFLQS